jgi:hypothetical protein
LQLDAWEWISDADGELQLGDWSRADQIGLFERWQKNTIRYLVPKTGEVFKVPRKSSGAVD